ncbi:hypothetical protein VSR68_28070 [Paraburkholderia phymatum]|uniref:hypothetical protein n=1 Tax=Paraburkholderia phymatum TaxID=148447 RepID=UPI0031723C59
MFAIKDSDIERFKAGTVGADWPLSSIVLELGEDTARRLGITALNVFAIYHPMLKPMITAKLDIPALPED